MSEELATTATDTVDNTPVDTAPETFVTLTHEQLASMSLKDRKAYIQKIKALTASIAEMNEGDTSKKKQKAQEERDHLLNLILGLSSQKIEIEAAGVVKELSIEVALKGEYHMIPVKATEGREADDEVQADGTVLRKHFFVLNGQRTKALTASILRLKAQMENKALRKPRVPKEGNNVDVLEDME